MKILCKLFGHKLSVVGTLEEGETLFCERGDWRGKRKPNGFYGLKFWTKLWKK